MDLLTMSKEELSRLEVMEHLQDRRMGQRTAAEVLGVSERQVKRLLSAYRREGAAGLVSKQRGKPSHHQLDARTVQTALDLLKGRFADFGPTLAHEKLDEMHGMKLCLGSVRKIMIEEGLWKAKRAQKEEKHPLRERRACNGELEQMDGTDHDWFEGRSERCTLLVMIDDATGQLGALLFVGEESFFGYCGLVR
jgi:transposase